MPRASISGAKADGNPFLNAQVSAKRVQKLLEEKKLQQYGSTDGVCSEQGSAGHGKAGSAGLGASVCHPATRRRAATESRERR